MDLKAVLIFAAIQLTALLGNSVSDRVAHKEHHVPSIFAFGDSIADAGTNTLIPQATARADFPPYGKTFFRKPTGRFTNGRTIVDFISQVMELPFAPPFLQPYASFTKGVNFASGGSGLLESTSEVVNSVSMRVQVQQFATVQATLQKQFGVYEADKLISKSIFLFISGSNDLTTYLRDSQLRQRMNATEFVSSLIDTYQKILLEVHNSGARKVAVFGVGPIGSSPSARATNPSNPGEPVEDANQLALALNNGLKQMVDRLRVALPGLNVVLFNSFITVSAMIDNGRSFGLDNVTAACCGAGYLNAQVQCGKPVPQTLLGATQDLCSRPYKFLFWDWAHPTEHAVSILSHLLFNGNSTVAYPINLKELAAL